MVVVVGGAAKTNSELPADTPVRHCPINGGGGHRGGGGAVGFFASIKQTIRLYCALLLATFKINMAAR